MEPEIKGYAKPTRPKVDEVNINKVLEERVMRRLDEMKDDPDVDQRMLALGVTNIQQAFMWINRAIFQPDRVAGDLD